MPVNIKEKSQQLLSQQKNVLFPSEMKAGYQDNNAITFKFCVLYIDDNSINLKLVSRILSKKKHIHLITAQTPSLGIEIAIKNRPNLIMLDINMPEMNGFQVLEVFKNHQNFKTTPIIAVTANAMPDDIAYGKSRGFDDYITKPIDYEHLIKTINKHLEYKQRDVS